MDVVHEPAPPLGTAQGDPDYLAVAKKVNRIDIYKDAPRYQDAAAKDASHGEADDGVSGRQRRKKYAGNFKIKVA